MSDDTGKVDEILDELDLSGDISGTPSESVDDDETISNDDSDPAID